MALSVPNCRQARAQVDFVLRPDRGIAAAQAFFRKALASHPDRPPRKVTLDGHVPSHRALRLLRREQPAWRRVRVRSSKYLNNIIEQDHRAIKRRCASMKGFKFFDNAAITIAGVELAHHRELLARRRAPPPLRAKYFRFILLRLVMDTTPCLSIRISEKSCPVNQGAFVKGV
jgi:transposase-like protein